MRVFVDTSAAAKLLKEEAETPALKHWLDANEPDLVAINVLETELRRMAIRDEIDQFLVTDILDGIGLEELSPADYRVAGLMQGKFLRSLDALHLQGAIKLDADAILAYDNRMTEAARAFGFRVSAPK